MSSFRHPARHPARRLARFSGGLLRLGAAVLAVLIGAVSSTPIAAADKAQTTKAASKAKKNAKAKKDPRGAKTSTPATASKAAAPSGPATSASTARTASPPAGTEAADIAELRARQAAGEVVLMRRHTVDDLAIEVWSTGLSRKFYVAVAQQGLLRRTLTSADETQAWRGFDSFRRMAAAGEVGRPVLLGRLSPPGAAPSPSVAIDAPAHAAGQEVATLRRERIGNELARLVWDAGASEYVVSLTRDGAPVAMQRSPDAVVATCVYEEFLRQAEARAALLPADQGR